jgi:predicted dehydrogenase
MPTVGIAVVGGGHWGPHLIRNFHDHPQSEVRWIVETSEDRRRALKARFDSIAVVEDLQAPLADPQVDAVVIATPTSTHAELGKAVLQAGKHLLVEKPLADSASGARRLCELARERGLVLMVGHVFLFNPAVLEGKRLIANGDLGFIHYLSMVRTNLGPIRGDVNAAWDLASHDISIANDWLGGEPVNVSARGGSWINPGVEDAVFITLEYPRQVLVHIHASWLHPRKTRTIAAIGSEKMLTVNDLDQFEPIRIYDKGVAHDYMSHLVDTIAGFRSQIHEGAVHIPPVPSSEPLRVECDHFIEGVQRGLIGRSDGWTGLAVVRALEATALSVTRGGALVEMTEIP